MRGETALTCFCRHTSQGLVCGCHGGQGHPILQPDALGVHIPSSTGAEGLANVSEFTHALLPGRRVCQSPPPPPPAPPVLFLGVLRGHKGESHRFKALMLL